VPGYKRLRNSLRIAPRGFEPLNNNSKALVNKQLTENSNPVLSTSLDKTLQKYPDLAQLVKVWSELPEHTKTAIKALVQTHKAEKK
jgi:hypothetical protein